MNNEIKNFLKRELKNWTDRKLAIKTLKTESLREPSSQVYVRCRIQSENRRTNSNR